MDTMRRSICTTRVRWFPEREPNRWLRFVAEPAVAARVANGHQVTVRRLLTHIGELADHTAINLKTVLVQRRWTAHEGLRRHPAAGAL